LKFTQRSITLEKSQINKFSSENLFDEIKRITKEARKGNAENNKG